MATTHTTSSPLPWNRNGVETGGPVRIGQVHTCTGLSHYLFVGAHGLWENSAAVQTRLGRARTVSRLQGYPVSRANEPRELPYVVEPIRAERIGQGLPVVNGRPSFSRPVSSALLPRAEKMVRSDPSLPPLPSPRFPEIWRITNAVILEFFFQVFFERLSCFSSIWWIIYALVGSKKKVVQITSFFFESKFNAVKFSSGE